MPHGRLAEFITLAEDALRALRETPYHAVLGRDFLGQADDAATYLGEFFERASKTIIVRVLYFEMNGFEINPDVWFFNGFAYEEEGDRWDLDWLSDCDVEPGEEFLLTGMDPVKRAFADVYADKRQPMAVHLAGELAEHLVNARYMELIAEAHHRAKGMWKALEGLPVLATAHEWDTVHRTT